MTRNIILNGVCFITASATLTTDEVFTILELEDIGFNPECVIDVRVSNDKIQIRTDDTFELS